MTRQKIDNYSVYRRFDNNCKYCSVATARIHSDVLNKAFSVHLCDYSHGNSAKAHIAHVLCHLQKWYFSIFYVWSFCRHKMLILSLSYLILINPNKATILCTISLAISYVSHLFALIFVQYRTISTAMTRTGCQANESTILQSLSFKYAFWESMNCRRGQ